MDPAPELTEDHVRPTVTGTANVVCYASPRLEPLSYTVPDTLTVRVGDLVHVPFGKRTSLGIVTGDGDPERATRPIEETLPAHTTPELLDVAADLAQRHFTPLAAAAQRLLPGKDTAEHEPLALEHARLRSEPTWSFRPQPSPDHPARVLIPDPLVDATHLAAAEAVSMTQTRPGAQALILCPTTEHVTATLRHFTAGAIRLDARAKPGAHNGFRAGTVPIAVATRAAALAYAPALAGIVVVDEDHPGHQEAKQPHWHARDVAVLRSQRTGGGVVLISSTPTANALALGASVHQVGGRDFWPQMRLVDRSDLDPVDRALPYAVRGALRRAGTDGTLPVVLAQRAAAVRRCRSCGAPRPCPQCEDSTCPHPQLDPCPECGHANGVRMAGWDQQRIEALVGPYARVMTLPDLKTTTGAGTVVVFDIDAALRAPGIQPDALAASIVLTACRAAGAGGSVIAMTDDPSAPLLQDLFQRKDLVELARRTWRTARAAQLPPFAHLVTIRCRQLAAPSFAGWPGQVHGPRRAGGDWETLIRIPTADLELLRPRIDELRAKSKARITVA